jgi:hypothetical protein
VLLPKVVESTEPPARNRVEHPRVEKIDVTSQESEILRRELAMQKSKSPARVEETTRVEPVPTVVPSTKQTVEPIVAIPHPPMKPAAEPVVVVSESDVPMTRSAASDKEKTVALKSMDIHYGQADTFKSITGQVQLYRKTWRLRYADVGQEDSYGGVVVLEGSADLSKLRDGCHIRVTGVLVPPATRTGLAMYRVQSLEILD